LDGFQIKLFFPSKQLDFPFKTSYFPKQNNLIRDAKQLVLENQEIIPGLWQATWVKMT